MSHRDTKWADAVGKMPPVNLHDTGGLATNLPVCKKRSICRAGQTGCACPPACGCEVSAMLRAGQGAVSSPVFVLGRCGRPPSPRAGHLGLGSGSQGWHRPRCCWLPHFLECREVTHSFFLPWGRGRGWKGVLASFYCSFLQGFGNH